MKLKGTVQNGFGKGAAFVRLYSEKIKATAGFIPFPGTLNLIVNPLLRKVFLNSNGRKTIAEFEQNGITYGAVYLYDIKLEEVVDAAIIIPVRTTHNKEVMEIITAEDLRNRFNIENEAEVIIERK